MISNCRSEYMMHLNYQIGFFYSFFKAINETSIRVLREAGENAIDDKPILDLDEIHCLSDWSLLIVVGVASANAIFFFYHMVLILAVRLRQQVRPFPLSYFYHKWFNIATA